MHNELKHYGVKGMKWGVRRYQNPDGTYTKAGLKRYQKKNYKAFKKAYEEGGDAELRKNEEFAKAADRLKKANRACRDAYRNRERVYDAIAKEEWVSKKAEVIWAEREKRLVPYRFSKLYDNTEPEVRDRLIKEHGFNNVYEDPLTGDYGHKSKLKQEIINDIVKSDDRYKDAAQKYTEIYDATATIFYDTAREVVGRYANKRITIHDEDLTFRRRVDSFMVGHLMDVVYSSDGRWI